MRKIDYLSVNGRDYLVFLAVFEEMSVTRAARRLNVTQSSVSHTLDKLRAALCDELFIRAGRGITATERAWSLREPIQAVVHAMRALTDARDFDPLTELMEFTIAANDYQRDLLFPPLLRELSKDGIDARFHFLPSEVPDATMLRDGRCDLMITPFPPDATDVVQTTLFHDHLVCFFDGQMRDPPKTLEEFLASDHIEVRFPNHTSALSTITSIDVSRIKRPKVSVPNFGALTPLMRGTRLITAQFSTMKLTSLQDFSTAPLPFDNPTLKLFMAWHQRAQTDPAHAWLRKKIQNIARGTSMG